MGYASGQLRHARDLGCLKDFGDPDDEVHAGEVQPSAEDPQPLGDGDQKSKVAGEIGI